MMAKPIPKRLLPTSRPEKATCTTSTQMLPFTRKCQTTRNQTKMNLMTPKKSI